MKKYLTLLLFCLMALNASAKSSSSADTILIIVDIVLIVFGILNIILFFKIWGMTNNVSELKEHLTRPQFLHEDDTDKKMRWLLLKGDTTAAEELLLSHFAEIIEEKYIYAISDGYHIEYAYKQGIKNEVEDLKHKFKLLGKEVPEKISKMKTIGDYINLWDPQQIEEDTSNN